MNKRKSKMPPPTPRNAVEVEPISGTFAESFDSSSKSEEEVQDQVKDTSSTATKPRSPKRRKKTSLAWEHFNPEKIEGECLKAICKHCGAKYMADPNKHGTKNLKTHVQNCKVLKEKQKGPMDNYTISYDANSSVNEMKLHKFDPNDIREALVEWIICDELPFRIVDSPNFQKFIKTLEPRYDVPSRVTVARWVFRMFVKEREKLKDLLKGDIGRVSLTTDMWTSSNNTSYMCVTGHFIDKSWRLHKRIIGFRMVEDHSGASIGKQLEIITKEWGIEKIMCITVDNASANDNAVDWVKKFGSRHLLGGNHLHVRCFAHILNLMVKYGLQQCDESVERIRTAVKYVRSSPKRQSQFFECAKIVGVQSSKSLCLDVATRWNSTYLMLQVAVEFELVFDRMGLDDTSYKKFFYGSKVLGAPTSDDWANARKILPLLEPFYDATTILSGTSYVTINQYFYQFAAIREHLHGFSVGHDIITAHIAIEMKHKYDQYFGNNLKINMLVYVSLALDPRSKMEVVKQGLEKTFDLLKASELYEETLKLLKELFEEYRLSLSVPQIQSSQSSQENNSHTTGGSCSTEVSSKATKSVKAIGMWNFVRNRSESTIVSAKTELDKYLDEQPEDPTDDFDLLLWWKLMQGRFPTLSKMARDLFSIPASTVASESAFSTGGRVITDRRNSLLPRTVEALICTQSWIKNVVAIDSDECMFIVDQETAEAMEKAATEELDGATQVSSTSGAVNIGD